MTRRLTSPLSFGPARTGSTRRRAAVAVSSVVIAALALAGCGSKGTKEDGPESQATKGGSQLAAVWPLTGLPVKGKTPNHPVMVVKIDNTAASDPQIGLGKADMVVEELVEGGITRLAALFYSTLPEIAGPVRSARASDIGVVKPTNAVLIASGMAPPTVGRLNAAKVQYFTMGAPGVYRDANDPQHDYLHSVFVKLPELAKTLKKRASVPPPYLPWGSQSDFSGVAPAKNLSVHMSGSTTTQFRYDAPSKKYLNVNTYAASGDEFKADSVLVLRVREGDAGYRDPAGNPVPETLFFGKGKMLLFHHGQLMRGSWSKQTRESAIELSTAAGSVKMPPGHVWIELLPIEKAGGHLSFSR